MFCLKILSIYTIIKFRPYSFSEALTSLTKKKHLSLKGVWPKLSLHTKVSNESIVYYSPQVVQTSLFVILKQKRINFIKLKW